MAASVAASFQTRFFGGIFLLGRAFLWCQFRSVADELPSFQTLSLTPATLLPPELHLNLEMFRGFSASSFVSGDLWHLNPKANGFKCLHLTENYKPNRTIHRSLRSPSMVSPMAQGANTTQDTDDMYDDLFKKYGKVVYRSKDQKSPTAEAEDDAECLAFAVALAKIASDVKAADIKVLFVKPLVYWTRFFIITTAFSRPQIDAIRTKINDVAEKQYGKVATGDFKPNSWTLLDFGDVVVHIFLPEQRQLYNLEEFYANATPIELPFENQQSFRP